MPNAVDSIASDPEIAPLLSVNYLRFHQRKEHQREIEDVDRVLNDPVERKNLSNPGALRQQNEIRKRTFRSQVPPPLTASQRDKLERVNREALASAKEGMLSTEELRHKPTGASDRLRAYEKAKKPHILIWKRSQILLHPESDDRDLCNLEKFRPSRPTVDLLANADLPAVHAMSPQAKENWPLGEAGFSEAEMRELETKGKITRNGFVIKKVRARALRKPGNYKSIECKHTGCERHDRPFTGPMGGAQYKQHVKRKHGGIEAA